MRRTYLFAFLAFIGAGLSSLSAFAGVTIHYQGIAKGESAARQAIGTARKAARERGWSVADANVAVADVTRVVNEVDKPYHGPLTGVVVRVHPMYEPIYIQFGSDLFMQDFVKTQFAGPDVHVAIVELLRALRPFFRTFEVVDEGDYWETRDRKRLEEHMNTVNRLIEAAKKTRPSARSPVKTPDGRFIDLLQ